MINIIKSNLKRSLRGWGKWAILALLVAFLALCIIGPLQPLDIGPEYDHDIAYTRETLSYFDSMTVVLNVLLTLVVAVMVHLVVGSDVASRMYVHQLTGGYTRVKIYLAELISATLIGLAIYALFYVPYLLVVRLIGGGYYLSFEQIVYGALAGAGSVTGICALATLICLCVKNRVVSALTSVILLAVYFVMMMVILANGEPAFVDMAGAIFRLFPPSGKSRYIWGAHHVGMENFEEYFEYYGYTLFTGKFWEYAVAGIGFALLNSGLGVLLFRKRDLK